MSNYNKKCMQLHRDGEKMFFSTRSVKKKRIKSSFFSELFNQGKGRLTVFPSNFQHIGRRDNQEDSFAFNNIFDTKNDVSNGFLAVLADGMGGLDKGKEASQKAVDSFLSAYEIEMNQQQSINRRLEQAAAVANTAVFDLAFRDGKDYELGTTLVAAVVYMSKLYWLSVGDSRAYHYREGSLMQLTTDHIYANVLEDEVQKGLTSITEAEEHPQRDHLTSYLGLPQLIAIDKSIKPITLAPGDLVMLCSDGLYNSLNDEEIAAVLSNDSEDPASELVYRALDKDNPYQDNVTVVILTFLE